MTLVVGEGPLADPALPAYVAFFFVVAAIVLLIIWKPED